MQCLSKETIQNIRKIDLLTYLKNNEPDELVYIGKDNYCTKTHDSLKLSNGMWYWFSRGIGGKSALDYLIKVKEYSFKEAIDTIISKYDIDNIVVENSYTDKENIKLILPDKASNNNKVIAYLRKRGITLDVINYCISRNYLYQDLKGNVVFIGYDRNENAQYASVRATNDTRFMHEVYGSNKAFSFKIISSDNTESVHIFESAIDLLSYYSLVKLSNKELETNLLSLAGVYQPASELENSKIPVALNNYLKNNIRTKRIFLHLDNDDAGRRATEALKKIMPDRYEVIDSPPPYGKDYNDFLCYIIKKNLNREER